MLKLVLGLLALLMTSSLAISNERPLWNDNYIAPGHHKFHHWYQYIQRELNIIEGGCCDEESQDCGPVADFIDLGNYEIKLLMEDGQWHPIGSETMVYYVDTPDGGAHACREPDKDFENKVYLDSFSFYCVFLPAPKLSMYIEKPRRGGVFSILQLTP